MKFFRKYLIFNSIALILSLFVFQSIVFADTTLKEKKESFENFRNVFESNSVFLFVFN